MICIEKGWSPFNSLNCIADEFNAYYQLHKKEIDNTTIYKLNKLYHIDGNIITKIKNVLMLKNW